MEKSNEAQLTIYYFCIYVVNVRAYAMSSFAQWWKLFFRSSFR